MLNERRVPVFVINGFLESGKTTFIKNAILRDPNISKERVVIICCEEGESEYESLPDNIRVHIADEKEEFTSEKLCKIDQKYNPTCVIIEYNVIWSMKTLYDTAMPDTWTIATQLTIIDAETFEGYFTNMKSIFADMLRLSNRVYMNRCTRGDNFKFYRDSIKASAPRAEIAYVSDEEGRLDIVLEEDLPYDLNSDVITINKDSYLTWYIDMLDNPDRYLEKTVEYTAQITKSDHFREGFFLAGNMVMTCCEDDMQFFGFLCQYDNTPFLKEGALMKLRGKVHCEFAPEYEKTGPVLYIMKATSIQGQKKKKKK